MTKHPIKIAMQREREENLTLSQRWEPKLAQTWVHSTKLLHDISTGFGDLYVNDVVQESETLRFTIATFPMLCSQKLQSCVASLFHPNK